MESKNIKTDKELFDYLKTATHPTAPETNEAFLYLNKDISFFKNIRVSHFTEGYSWTLEYNQPLTTKKGYIIPTSRGKFTSDLDNDCRESFKTLSGCINNLIRCLEQAPWLFLPELVDGPQCFRLKHNLWVYELPFKFRKILILKNHPINLVQIKAVHDSNYSIIEYRGIKFEIERKKLLKNLQ